MCIFELTSKGLYRKRPGGEAGRSGCDGTTKRRHRQVPIIAGSKELTANKRGFDWAGAIEGRERLFNRGERVLGGGCVSGCAKSERAAQMRLCVIRKDLNRTREAVERLSKAAVM